ncbi:MAG: hypothetical protein GC171_13730 [Terrimonas sp.]|nr:hypothetical protein [Terrimonas sp.]
MKRVSIILLLFFVARSVNGQQNTLEFFIDRALENSPLLKDLRNQAEANLADSQLVIAGYKPQVTGSSYNSYAPVIKGFGYDKAITNGSNIAALIGINKTIVGKNNLGSQFESIRLNNETANNTGKITEQELKRSVTAQYITTWSDLLQIDFNREILDLLKKEEVLLKVLTAKNVYRQTDYLAFLVTLQQQDLLLKQLSIQYRNDVGTLNYLSGVVDTGSVTLIAPAIELNTLPELASSVFFHQFTLDSLKLKNSRDLLNYSYKPKINLFADGGYNSSLAYRAYKNFGVSLGISLSVPIYDGQQKKIRESKLALAEKTITGYKDYYAKQYEQQLAQLKQQLSATERLLLDIREQIKYAETLITVNGKLLQTGETRIADYILAINNYLNAKNLLTQNRVNRLQIINEINYWNR